LNTYLLFVLFLLTYAKCLLFVSLFSENEDPKRDAATAPLVNTPTANEQPSQEAAMVVKLPKAPPKKGNSHASKRLKKAAVASTSLDTHRPVGAADDVSIASCGLLFLLLELFFSCLPFDRL
jgi:hypothetical protein